MLLPTTQLGECSNTHTSFTHLDLVVAITRHICCLITKHLPLPAVREGIPDARPFPILIPGTLCLEGRAAHTPREACKQRPQAELWALPLPTQPWDSGSCLLGTGQSPPQ